MSSKQNKRKSKVAKQRQHRKNRKNFHRKYRISKFSGPYSVERFSEWLHGLNKYELDQVAAELLIYCHKSPDVVAAEIEKSLVVKPGENFEIEIVKKLAEIARTRRFTEMKKVEMSFFEKQKAGQAVFN